MLGSCSVGDRLTPEALYAAMEKVRDMPYDYSRPVVYNVGDDFHLARRLVEAGCHIACSPRVRVLLGEHLP